MMASQGLVGLGAGPSHCVDSDACDIDGTTQPVHLSNLLEPVTCGP